MRLLLALMSVFALAACTFVVLDEINYRSTPLAKGSDSYPAALEYAREWASQSDLKITGQVPPRESRKQDSAIIELRSAKWPKLYATVLANGEYGIVCATVAPARDNAGAAELAAGAVRAYKKLYPASSFEPFERRQGLFAP